jgi:dihydroorotate dehydrogenase (fumarate)
MTTIGNRIDSSMEGQSHGMESLESSFMGIRMSSPVIAGSCPLNINPEMIRQLVEAGVGAVVLPSILQEQLVFQSMMKSDSILATEQSGHAPQQDRYNGGPEAYLKSIEANKEVFSTPLIASIHGASTGDWLDYVCRIQDSGADGLELNWQIGRCDPSETGDQVESRMLSWLEQIRARVTIPIAFKMNARFTNPAAIAIRLQNAGVNALVLFAHRPNWNVDIERMHWTVGWELSPTTSLGKTLEGLVEIRTKNLRIPVAASGGVRTGDDAIKAMIAGANFVMIVSELYRQGPVAVKDIIAGIRRYLSARRLSSLDEFLESRPIFEDPPTYSMRSEIVDPLTVSGRYVDPTPVESDLRGDRFGHPSH